MIVGGWPELYDAVVKELEKLPLPPISEEFRSEYDRLFAMRPGLHGETGGATHGATGA